MVIVRLYLFGAAYGKVAHWSADGYSLDKQNKEKIERNDFL